MRQAFRYFFFFLIGVSAFLVFWFLAGPSVLRGLQLISSSHCGILAVEGWLPESLLKTVADLYKKGCYTRLMVTGVTLPDDVEMLYRGELHLNPDARHGFQICDTLFVKLSGTKASGQRPSGHIFVNDRLAVPYVATRKPSWIAVPAVDSCIPLTRIRICFENDAWTRYADRNLYVHALRIHGKEYLPRSMRAFYIRLIATGTDTVDLNFTSVPGQAAWFLQQFGIPEEQMDVIAVHGVHSDKTWHSMKALAAFMKRYFPNDSSLVIVTHPFHARRTLMMARRAFGPQVTVNIIPTGFSGKWWKNGNEIKLFLKESVGFFWFWIHIPDS